MSGRPGTAGFTASPGGVTIGPGRLTWVAAEGDGMPGSWWPDVGRFLGALFVAAWLATLARSAGRWLADPESLHGPDWGDGDGEGPGPGPGPSGGGAT